MSPNQQLVSIIIPVFNRKDIIKETLKSIKDQSYTNWEVVFIDDGSTDGTYEYLQSLALEEPRYILNKRDRQPKGASSCRNMGIDMAKGDYVIFLDSDDILFPTCFEERIRNFKLYPANDFLIFPAVIFTNTPGDSSILWNIDKEKNDILRFLELDVPWQTTAPIWKRSSLSKVGYWDDSTSAWEDMDFHIRALIYGLKYKKINNGPDYYYRVANADKLSKNDKTIKQLYSRIVLIIRIIGYFQSSGTYNELHKKKVFKFYMWICHSFLKLRHYEGVSAACKSLYKMGFYSWTSYIFTLQVMKGNKYFFDNSFFKLFFKSIRNLWMNTVFKYYFEDLPPLNCTVKTIEMKVDKIKPKNLAM
ncbi:MAG: glycosyltransferase family 2 protein [Bacteroidota bacterium]|nr:glycosyltransferase family 2 protein [Bacteroidota bacterium]